MRELARGRVWKGVPSQQINDLLAKSDIFHDVNFVLVAEPFPIGNN